MNFKVYFLIFLITVLCCCKKYTFICSNRDMVEEAGIKHFQEFVDQVEKYKISNGKYPKDTKELEENIFDGKRQLPTAKITGAKYGLKPEEDYFEVRFYFDREKACLVGNNRACEYTSISRKWSCY